MLINDEDIDDDVIYFIALIFLYYFTITQQNINYCLDQQQSVKH